MSNFYEAPFKMDGKIWSTTEHYFQAQKFKGTLKEELIRTLTTPLQAFSLGKLPEKEFPVRQ